MGKCMDHNEKGKPYLGGWYGLVRFDEIQLKI